MSAVGRLWRRAPTWRLCLVTAIVFTALAAMFPPTLPQWQTVAALFGHAPPPAAGTGAADAGTPAATARYVPQPDPPPPDYDTIESPPLGQGQSGIIAFAGRQLPLPFGNWQELVLVRGGGPVPVQAMLLARIEERQLTGLLLAAAPDPMGGADRPVVGLEPCFDPNVIAHQLIPASPGQGPMARECWTLALLDMSNAASHPKFDQVMQEGLARLNRLGIAVTDHMLALRYLRSDATGWMTALLVLPDRHAEPLGAGNRLQTWAKRFVPEFHKGFDRTLTPGDMTPAIARDPE